MVRVTPTTTLPKEKEHRYPFDRRMVGITARLNTVYRNVFPLREIELQFLWLPRQFSFVTLT
jgi:hypothetical protein